jgi:diguanylate cyclase (GGDEF)-like protein
MDLPHAGNEAGIVTISAGVAAFVPRRDVDVSDELLRAADRALYLAKQEGRDRVCSSVIAPEDV